MESSLKKEKLWFFIPLFLSLGFALFVSYSFLFELDKYKQLAVVLPFALGGISLLLLKPKFTAWAIVFLFPLSVNINNLREGFGISLPGEGLLWLLAIAVLIRSIQTNWIQKKFLFHPLSLLLFVQMFWLLFTSVTSEHSSVSFKLLVSRFVFILVFYFLFGNFFRDIQNIQKFIFLYAAGLLFVMVNALYRMAQYEFAQKFSPAMADPWYTDHTVFGACIAILFPFFFLAALNLRKLNAGRYMSVFIVFCFLVISASALFSYSRATWLSLAVSFLFLTLLFLRARFWQLGLIAIVISVVMFATSENYLGGKPDEVEDKETSLLFHASTITDVKTDESNLERLNRWSCAWRMFLDRPLTGFGPGTYEKVYGTYQASSEMTRISTYEGTLGDAHSEYFTSLSEQGLPGFLLFVVWVLLTIYIGMRCYRRAQSPKVRIIAAGVITGLFTFFIHAFVNDFIDIEKAACLIFGFSGMIVALDVWHSPEKNSEKIANFKIQKIPGTSAG